MPVDAIVAAGAGPDWSIALPEMPAEAPAGAEGAGASGGSGGSSFGGMLVDQVGALQGLQDQAAAQSQALATGTAEDASTVVMAVERAQLAMQLAATLRDKSVESFQEIFRTQV
jgi:flagellar hook-basal body complex protein FliE